jgi:hypothetical protein
MYPHIYIYMCDIANSQLAMEQLFHSQAQTGQMDRARLSSMSANKSSPPSVRACWRSIVPKPSTRSPDLANQISVTGARPCYHWHSYPGTWLSYTDTVVRYDDMNMATQRYDIFQKQGLDNTSSIYKFQ